MLGLNQVDRLFRNCIDRAQNCMTDLRRHNIRVYHPQPPCVLDKQVSIYDGPQRASADCVVVAHYFVPDILPS
jgi:hypothetical protein